MRLRLGHWGTGNDQFKLVWREGNATRKRTKQKESGRSRRPIICSANPRSSLKTNYYVKWQNASKFVKTLVINWSQLRNNTTSDVGDADFSIKTPSIKKNSGVMNCNKMAIYCEPLTAYHHFKDFPECLAAVMEDTKTPTTRHPLDHRTKIIILKLKSIVLFLFIKIITRFIFEK